MIKNVTDILSSISPLVGIGLPFSFCFFGMKKCIKIFYKEKFEVFDKLIQDRIFLKNMDEDLLFRSIKSLKSERKRRIKIKINSFLKINLFKVF